MRAVPSIAIVLFGCAGSAVAQWSVVETQEVEPAVLFGSFGRGIAISGDTAVVKGSSAVHAFDIDPVSGAWTEAAVWVSATSLGGGGLDLSGDTAAIGVPDPILLPPQEGEVRVIERDHTGTWTLTAVLPSPQTVLGFGQDVAISGDTIVAGCEGAVCVFERDGGGPGAWGLAAVLSDGDSSDSLFGADVDVDGDVILAGAPEFEQGSESGGGVFVFERSSPGGPWNHVATLRGSDTVHGDQFGLAVALSGDAAIVGAPWSDHIGAPDESGAAYVFERAESQWLELEMVTATSPAFMGLLGWSVAMDSDTAIAAEFSDAGQVSVAVLKRNHGGVEAWQAIAELSAPHGYDDDLAVSIDALAMDASLPANPATMSGMAFDPVGGVLYGAGSLNGVVYLFTLDPGSGAATPVGPTGFVPSSLAFDPAAGVLYGADPARDELIRIDPATGAGVSIGELGIGNMSGLDFDPLTGTLYGTNDVALFTIDVGTGAASAVGNVGFNIVGLAFDSGTGTLFGSSAGASQLIAIDVATGVGTPIGPIGFFTVEGLAMDASAGTLYGTSHPQLLAIDPLTGAGLALGPYHVPGNQGNSVHVFGIAHASESYCTAGTSASGCTASIAASGQASASAPSGFVLSASGVEGEKEGLFFFGSHGQQANPWGNGTSYQCVVPPVKRTGLLAGVGTPGACDGSFARDLNAYWCPACPVPKANPGAGAMIQAQLWYRDPQSTSNQPTSLSDAVESYVAP